MRITHATDADVPAIVALLKSSLGEGSSPKSAAYWSWKHQSNPFGQSPVLLAWADDDSLIGIRAFMRWRWQHRQKVFSALRAVDTATHPQHQGKGIFKKLTLQLVDESTEQGSQFVFNTPNDQSRPGYLKMGWQALAQIPVGIRLRPSGLLPGKPNPQEPLLLEQQPLEKVCQAWNAAQERSGLCFTPKSAAYISWRYAHNPVLEYQMMQEEDCFIAAYVRQRKGFRELRISELLLDTFDGKACKHARQMVKQLAEGNHAHIISYSACHQPLLGGMLSRVAALGPVLTLRKLAATDDEWNMLQQLPNWQLIMGDMELF